MSYLVNLYALDTLCCCIIVCIDGLLPLVADLAVHYPFLLFPSVDLCLPWQGAFPATLACPDSPGPSGLWASLGTVSCTCAVWVN